MFSTGWMLVMVQGASLLCNYLTAAEKAKVVDYLGYEDICACMTTAFLTIKILTVVIPIH